MKHPIDLVTTRGDVVNFVMQNEGGYSGYFDLQDLGQKGIALPLTLGTDEYPTLYESLRTLNLY